MQLYDSPWDALKASVQQAAYANVAGQPKGAAPSYYIIDLTGHQLVKDFGGHERSFSARYLAENEASKLASLASSTKRYLVVKSVVEIESKKTTQTISKEFA